MNIEYNFKFKDEDYFFILKAVDNTLEITMESNSTIPSYWRGVYSSDHIQSLTSSVGSTKSFNTFIKILICGITGESDQVSLDLLGFHKH